MSDYVRIIDCQKYKKVPYMHTKKYTLYQTKGPLPLFPYKTLALHKSLGLSQSKKHLT